MPLVLPANLRTRRVTSTDTGSKEKHDKGHTLNTNLLVEVPVLLSRGTLLWRERDLRKQRDLGEGVPVPRTGLGEGSRPQKKGVESEVKCLTTECQSSLKALGSP